MKISERERAATCTLNRIFGYEPVIAHRLIEGLGSAAALFGLDHRSKTDLLGPFSKHLHEITEEALERSSGELTELERRRCRFLCMTEDGYPQLLKECEDAPVGLYIRADSPDEKIFFQGRPSIAVVGTRDLSMNGRDWCRKIVEAMSRSRNKPAVVSGFALGTDIVAHSTALACGLPTIAVLPTGITSVYPRRHWKWAEQLAATEGCALVTDYPPGTEAIAINFLRRNRIIAGLCSATVLIESKQKGGGLITADFAFNYDRDVFALPGRPDDVRSQGCNMLIKRRVAEAILDPDTLMEELGLGMPSRRSTERLKDEIRSLYEGSMSPDEIDFLIAVAGCVKRQRGITQEEIAALMHCPQARVASATGLLEADGILEADLMRGFGIRTKVR